MRTIETTLYKYSELSEAGKQKAREYFKVRIFDRETGGQIAIIKVAKNESLNEAIRNVAQNIGYLRRQITYELI